MSILPVTASSLPKSRRTPSAAEKINDAFISYSHRSDRELSSKLQAGLEGLAKPWYRRSAVRVYRDETDLGATPELLPTILRELDKSKFLILMASPDAAQSEWVATEVDHWIQTKSPKTLLIAVTDGGIRWDEKCNDFDWHETTALTRRLEKVYQTQPLWVDLRWTRTAKRVDRADPEFVKAVAQLSAPIRGMDLRALFDKHGREHARALRHAWTAAVALLCLLVIAIALYFRSETNYRVAQRRLLDLYQEQGRQELVAGRPGRAAVYLSAAYSGIQTLSGAAGPGILPYLLGSAVRTLDAEAGVLSGHKASVRRAAYSGDGTLLATADLAGGVKIWDAKRGSVLVDLGGVGGFVDSVDLNRQATRILTFSAGAGAKLWDSRNGNLLHNLPGQPTRSAFGFARFSPDGSHILIVYAGQSPSIWDPRTGLIQGLLPGAAGSVFAGTFSPNGKLVVTAGLDGTARLYDVSTRKFLRAFSGHTDVVTSVFFDPRGTRIVTASADGSARIFEVASGITLQVLPAFQPMIVRQSDVMLLKFIVQLSEGFVPTAQFSMDGTYVLTADRNGIRKWDTDTGSEVATIGTAKVPFNWATFSPDGRTIATAGGDDTVSLWALDSGEALAILDGHAGPVHRLVFSPDGSQLVSLSDDRTARIWSVEASIARHELSPRGPECGYISFEGGSRMRVTGFARTTGRGNLTRSGAAWKIWALETLQLVGSGENEAEGPLEAQQTTGSFRVIPKESAAHPSGLASAVLVATSNGAPVATLDGHSGQIWNGRVSPDAHSVITASEDGTVRIWDIKGRTLHVLPHGVNVQVAEYTPDGKLIATGADDGRLRLWDAATGKLRVSIDAHRDRIRAIRFSPDGSRMLSISGADRTVKAWKMPEVTLLYQAAIETDQNQVIEARFSDDGLLLVTAARKRTIEVWDGWTGLPVSVVESPVEVVWDAAFTPDRKHVVATGENGDVVVFPFEYERRNADTIERLVRSHAAFRLNGGRLLVPAY